MVWRNDVQGQTKKEVYDLRLSAKIRLRTMTKLFAAANPSKASSVALHLWVGLRHQAVSSYHDFLRLPFEPWPSKQECIFFIKIRFCWPEIIVGICSTKLDYRQKTLEYTMMCVCQANRSNNLTTCGPTESLRHCSSSSNLMSRTLKAS